jgi:hypothetical protein
MKLILTIFRIFLNLWDKVFTFIDNKQLRYWALMTNKLEELEYQYREDK